MANNAVLNLTQLIYNHTNPMKKCATLAGVIGKDMLEVKRPVRSLLHHLAQRHTERDDEVPAEVWVGGERGERR